MRAESVDVQRLADELTRAMPALDEADQRVALVLYRLLAEGAPVAPERIAERAGTEVARVSGLLKTWPGVYLAEGRVVGFWGLALDEMPHRLRVDGRELRAWCAWDTLFLPELIGKPAGVESPCPVTGDTITLEVIPGEGATGPSPNSAVLSFLRREEPFDADTIMSFCHFVHFFALPGGRRGVDGQAPRHVPALHRRRIRNRPAHEPDAIRRGGTRRRRRLAPVAPSKRQAASMILMSRSAPSPSASRARW